MTQLTSQHEYKRLKNKFTIFKRDSDKNELKQNQHNKFESVTIPIRNVHKKTKKLYLFGNNFIVDKQQI